MSGGSARAFDVPACAAGGWQHAGRRLPASDASSWRVLRRQLRITLALIGHLARLRERLALATTAPDDDPALLWAAVALIVAPSPDAILLIQRARRPGDPWSGHMALPGGRRESQDEDLLATASRETWEEVGVAVSREMLVGALADVVPRIPTLPPVAVRPFLFTVPSRPNLTVNPEVAAAAWVSLTELLRPEAHQQVAVDIQGETREVWAYVLEAGVVWGMTERILTGFIEQLGQVCPTES